LHGGVIDSGRRRRTLSLALALLVHAALLGGLLRHMSRPADAPTSTMVWLKLAPPVRKPIEAPPPARTPSPPASAPPHVAKAAPPAPIPMAPPPPVVEAPPAAAPSSAPVSVEQMLAIARRDLGKIDRDLRKEQRVDQFSKAPDSAQLRLEKGFDEAHAAVPNKWYQAAKIEDITPPGDDARKIYRITGALGSYCVRYPDKNRVNQGKANAGEPLIGACPHMF
jgi:hypothetical protein